MEIEIHGESITLAPPGRVAVASSIVTAYAQGSDAVASAAAIGACWKGKGAPKARFDRHKWNVYSYGAEILDDLHGRGWTIADISTAALPCIEMLAAQLPRAAEVREAEDFSEVQAG